MEELFQDPENLTKLVKIKERIEEEFGIELKVVSGGNSSSYTLIESGEMISGINNLRLGEVILLGNETTYGKPVEGLYHDNFILEAQIIELKGKTICSNRRNRYGCLWKYS